MGVWGQVEMANEDGQSEDMLAYLGDFITERAYEESINVQGKSLVVLQMLCPHSSRSPRATRT